MSLPRVLAQSAIVRARPAYEIPSNPSRFLVRLKSNSALPTGTFRPLHHPLRGGKGVSTPPVSSSEGSRSASALLSKAANYAQRSLVTVMVVISVWGIYSIWDVHTQIMAKAQEAYDQHHAAEGVTLNESSSNLPAGSGPTTLTSQ